MPAATLRERNRLAAMMAIQDVAYELFADSAFDEVTVAEIAAQSGVGPATVYRYFRSKERILTWNEHDDEFAASVVRRLADLAPFNALRTAFVVDIAPLIDNERQRHQMRVLYGDPVLAATATTLDAVLIDAIAAAVRKANPQIPPLTADVTARAAHGALEASFASWQADDGSTPLATVVARAFDTLKELEVDSRKDSGARTLGSCR